MNENHLVILFSNSDPSHLDKSRFPFPYKGRIRVGLFSKPIDLNPIQDDICFYDELYIKRGKNVLSTLRDKMTHI